jgi:cbb3-type cytochrome oxidase subunit 3
MTIQNNRNHRRYIILWHIITSLAIIALFTGSLINLAHSAKENVYSASLLVLVSLIFFSVFWYARWFALRAQDRAIRAEENLRHFALTGKLLDSRLRPGQVIALRFAADEEFVALAKKAAEEAIRSAEIKISIVNWRPDYYRV